VKNVDRFSETLRTEGNLVTLNIRQGPHGWFGWLLCDSGEFSMPFLETEYHNSIQEVLQVMDALAMDMSEIS
jgi:hypothetical protein